MAQNNGLGRMQAFRKVVGRNRFLNSGNQYINICIILDHFIQGRDGAIQYMLGDNMPVMRSPVIITLI